MLAAGTLYKFPTLAIIVTFLGNREVLLSLTARVWEKCQEVRKKALSFDFLGANGKDGIIFCAWVCGMFLFVHVDNFSIEVD